MEKHQIPVNYLNNPALAEELQSAHDARTPAAIEAARQGSEGRQNPWGGRHPDPGAEQEPHMRPLRQARHRGAPHTVWCAGLFLWAKSPVAPQPAADPETGPPEPGQVIEESRADRPMQSMCWISARRTKASYYLPEQRSTGLNDSGAI
jgi:hypothetical protein